jgi:hypothetical protein
MTNHRVAFVRVLFIMQQWNVMIIHRCTGRCDVWIMSPSYSCGIVGCAMVGLRGGR